MRLTLQEGWIGGEVGSAFSPLVTFLLTTLRLIVIVLVIHLSLQPLKIFRRNRNEFEEIWDDSSLIFKVQHDGNAALVQPSMFPWRIRPGLTRAASQSIKSLFGSKSPLVQLITFSRMSLFVKRMCGGVVVCVAFICAAISSKIESSSIFFASSILLSDTRLSY